MPKTSAKISIASRVTISLVMLSTTTLMFARMSLGDRDYDQAELERRRSICESLAISCSLLVERDDREAIQRNLDAIVGRNRTMTSAVVRQSNGDVVANVGDHPRYWKGSKGASSARHNIEVPISKLGERWGSLEISFGGQHASPVLAFLSKPSVLMTLTTLVMNGLLFRWYLGRILTYLIPASAVPTHVRSTIDTFSEGVAVLDAGRRIVLANQAFAHNLDMLPTEITGRSISEFQWCFDDDDSPPWELAAEGHIQTGQPVRLTVPGRSDQTFRVSASPILDENDGHRGMIVSFDDISDMEAKRLELRMMLSELQISRDELTKRNRELQILATRDPLTGCLNRRTFFETFDKYWNSALRGSLPLSCAMVDIDYFKSINDNHGHQTGDDVLKHVAQTLQTAAGTDYLACRYGGEEFCFLMPNVDMDAAAEICEQIRCAISDLKVGSVRLTTSIGVSALSLSPADPQEMLDQADKCLFVAKRNGRNQVVRWDDVPDNLEKDEKTIARSDDPAIPYPAVAALLSALAYRHPDTAAHSTRVAELSVATARGLMSATDAYVLEVGALLHDIGKIGVPDAILLKPSQLTSEEWKVMHIHDRIGIEIIESSFANQTLVDVLRYHHVMYGGSPDAPNAPTGDALPLGARIVSIADAYDAIVSDRIYRKGRSQEEAFAELRKYAGKQFDPELVERFINVVNGHKSLALNVSNKHGAQQIASQIERLAEAIDAEDRDTILALASRLEAVAAHCKIPAIQDLAGEIKVAAGKGEDVKEMVSLTEQLVDLCRSTQHTYVEVNSPQNSPTSIA